MSQVQCPEDPQTIVRRNQRILISCDDLIIGGGLSGLLLAIELGSRFANRKIVILESRLAYIRDHTWSFWHEQIETCSVKDVHRWNGWNLENQGGSVVRQSDVFRYCSVRADDFYESCLEQIRGLENVELIFGARVMGTEPGSAGISCQADLGEMGSLEVNARRGFDSRLPSMSKNWVKQTFLGKHIRTSSPKFDPSRVTLMDFESEPECGILFNYVLPFAADSALVEVTAIGTQVPSRDYLRKRLDEYLTRAGIDAYETEYEESGLLPMSADLGEHSASTVNELIPIGTARGLARPASGYAFDEIQRWTRAFVAGLNDAGEVAKPIPLARPKLVTELDRIFLHQITKDPFGAPDLFMRLFRDTSVDVMPRFLRGQPTAGDLFEVVSHLPVFPLAKSALEVWLQKLEGAK